VVQKSDTPVLILR